MRQVEKPKKQNIKRRRSFITTFLIPFMIISVLTVAIILLNNGKDKNGLEVPDMNYDEVQDGDDKTQSEFVKFDAYFLNKGEDEFAKKVRGACASTTEDIELYMDLKVLNNGYLKDAKVTLEDANYTVLAGIIEDNEIDSFENNVITLREIQNGTAKNIQAILGYKSNTSLSKVSKIILNGIYVSNTGMEIEIYKEINVTVDFYTDVGLAWYDQLCKVDEASINNDEKTVYVSISLYPYFTPTEHPIEKSLTLEGVLPKFNGYDPIPESIKVYSDNRNLKNWIYDKETRKLTIKDESIIDVDGNLTKSIDRNSCIEVNYPYEAYESLGGTDVTLDFKFSAIGTAYGNPKIQPDLTTNTITKTLSIKASSFEEKGVSLYCDPDLYNTKKQNAYMFYNNQYKEAYFNIEYLVEYNYMPESIEKIVIKEDYTNSPDVENSDYKNDGVSLRSRDGTYYDVNDNKEYIGMNIWLTSASSNISSEEQKEIRKNEETAKEYDKQKYIRDFVEFLGKDGWINIYDDETGELIDTLDVNNDFGVKEPYDSYESTTTDSTGNVIPQYYFYYDNYILSRSVKKIRIEMSRPIQEEGWIEFYTLVNLNSKKLFDQFTTEEFDNLDTLFAAANIYVKYNNKDEEISLRGSVNNEKYIMHKTSHSTYLYQDDRYINPKFYAGKLAENLILKLHEDGEQYEDWKNGIIMVEFPSDLININIKGAVQQDRYFDPKENIIIYEDEKEIKNYQKFTKDGKTYLKIYTDGELNSKIKEITINFDAFVSPFSVTSTKYVNTYYYNELATGYDKSLSADDIYDINDNGNITDKVGKNINNIYITAPTGLVTATQGSHFNTRGDVIISPQVGTVFKRNSGRIAQVDVIMQNSYNNSIQDVLLLGKFPYEGNKSPITNTVLDSTYTANVLGEIAVPDNLKDTVTVYYSTSENTNKDLTDTSNGWITGDKVTDWSTVRTYLIDFGNTVIGVGDNYTFSYNISFPDGLDYEEVTYATHGIYFNLNTASGLLKMNTEPSKVGFRVGPEYTFELDTQIFEKGTDKVISNAKVLVKGPGMGEGKEYITDENGYVYIQGLYADEEYTIEEVEVPDIYILDTDVIKFRVNSPVNEENQDPFTFDLLENSFRNTPVITQDSFGNTKIHTELENETQVGKVIVKYVDREGNELLPKDTIDGKVGDEYTTERKPVEGYKAYGEEPYNKEGKMTEGVIEVIYIYDKVPAKVIVKYVDEEGNELLPEDIIDGKPGDEYTTERKVIEGYVTSGNDPENRNGRMIEGVIEVVYVYKKISVNTGDINIGKYVIISLIAIVGIAGVIYSIVNKKRIG